MYFQFSVFGSYTSRFGFRFGSVNRRPLITGQDLSSMQIPCMVHVRHHATFCNHGIQNLKKADTVQKGMKTFLK